jgi:hypothetical protein
VLQYQPLTVAPSLPVNAMPPGALALSGSHPLLLGIADRSRQDLPDPGFCLSTSPNGRLLSYCESSDNWQKAIQLVIAGVDGIPIRRIPVEPRWMWSYAVSWLGHDQVVLNLLATNLQIDPVYSVVIVNAQSGATQELASDYPGLQPSIEGPAGTFQLEHSSVVYDPSLNLVVYPETAADGEYIVLWERRSTTALARLRDFGGFHHAPLWTVDGETFAIAVEPERSDQPGQLVEEWFSVSRIGQVAQLTRFGDYFQRAQIGEGSLSPDGNHIAFWLNASPSECPAESLAILEIDSHRVIDYCLRGSDSEAAPAGQPVWSPDSRYIAVDSYYNASSHAIVVDTEQNWAADLHENAIPKGWLVDIR